MKCLICNKEFTINITWGNLFREKNYDVCDNCFKRYPIKPNYQLIPLKNKAIHWFSLFDQKYSFSSIAFVKELSKLFSYVLKANGIILYYDYVDGDTLDKIIELEEFGLDIYLVTCFIDKY